METYSVVVSIYGWTIKNTRTGKTITGTMEKMPHAIYHELVLYTDPGDRAICTARSIHVPEHAEFNNWFRITI